MIEVIPAIDLMGGLAVRAKKGLRHTYAPIKTPLAKTSAPLDVAAGLFRVYPFRTLYIADLDAIERRGTHELVIARLSAAFPDVALWVDAGVCGVEQARAFLARHSRADLVLGSESLPSRTVLEELAGCARILLSLDYRGGRFAGPGEICKRQDLWPERVIVMTLARVGTNAGPDLRRLAGIKRKAPNVRIYAAGGLRDVSDFKLLQEARAEGILVASALHEGRLTSAHLAALESESAARGHK
jgi:phosphoribosylformimino-5-aminoimidazole carboxamide ribotide isomerase